MLASNHDNMSSLHHHLETSKITQLITKAHLPLHLSLLMKSTQKKQVKHCFSQLDVFDFYIVCVIIIFYFGDTTNNWTD